jgi:hypothetical protein
MLEKYLFFIRISDIFSLYNKDMHNTVLIFLLGLLLSFGINMNAISKAMALNIVPSTDNDENNYLQRYEQFYKDDSFREAYYNYHKQHHNQQELSQPSYNNHYSNTESYNHETNKKYDNYKPEYTSNSYDQESYGKDHEKFQDKNSVILKKLKCNNINVNFNNVELNLGSPVNGDNTNTELSTGENLAVQDTNTISSNGERSFVDSENNFAFVCINNNNNGGQGNNTSS